MRLWSRLRSRGKDVRTPRRPAPLPSWVLSREPTGLRAGDAEIVDLVADGAISWHSPTGDAFHPVDPYLVELGWRAWDCMIEENVLGSWGFPESLVNFWETGI